MARSFTKIVAFAFVLTFVFGMARTSRAQSADNGVIQPLTAQGSAAFIFNLAGIGTFGFGGPSIGPLTSGVGLKYYISDDLALRILAGLNTTSGMANDTNAAKPSTTNFGIGVGVETHFRPLYSTSPYVGAQISFGSSSDDNGESGNGSETSPPEVKHSSSTFNVAVLAGFDWFMTKGMALGGEMNLGFTSTSSSTTIGSTTTNNQSMTGIGLATGGDVHFLVYF
ncbi:MAG TPA: outer membrane beta-barrel protein [Candidatus Kapabacteria bacterium]|nr:outer membrane beta-barrel protein [Candidatus Kapabacteria bacterium]